MAHSPNGNTWSKPAAMAIPKEGYHKLENGRYGPLYPRTPANHGFTIIAKVQKGREQAVREYGKTIEGAIAGAPDARASSTPTSTNTPRTPSPCSTVSA